MFEKTLMTLAAAAALAAAAGVAVVAAAFAVYQGLLYLVPPAGASAIVAGVCALIIGLVGLIAANKAHGGGKHRQAASGPVDHSLVEKLVEIVKDRPLLASGAAIAAGIFALRNPAFISAVVKGFMDSQPGNRN